MLRIVGRTAGQIGLKFFVEKLKIILFKFLKKNFFPGQCKALYLVYTITEIKKSIETVVNKCPFV